MNLIVDYGNTTAKVGIFDQQELVQKFSFDELSAVEKFLHNTPADNAIISSVNVDPYVIAAMTKATGQRLVLDHKLPLPIINQYETPETLGMDRIAAACGAIKLFPGQNTLVINAGTCVIYDFIDGDGKYWGGAISPGLNMRFKAVNAFTKKLPLVEPVEGPELIGKSTETSLQSGIINGLAAEIDGIIDRYKAKYKEMKVILGGGDGPFFENKLKASIFASPNVVLVGLNSILVYNVNR